MADPVRDRPGPDYPGLIKPDRVHGSLYTDPRVVTDELARIWYRTWVYVGHESEVGQPGDYVRKSLGLRDVIPYRGWTCENTGELIGFPFNQGYGGKGTIEAELSLASVPRTGSHQGLAFGSMAEADRVRFLDALELETIVWLPEGHPTQLLDPSADRWRDA
jgi:phenylpropionate dioxygenase-like ring-hydroxylating dioxygenase large terminal subunit